MKRLIAFLLPVLAVFMLGQSHQSRRAVDTNLIVDDTILEIDLDAIDTAANNECLTYDSATGGFEWQVCAGASGNSFETWSGPTGTDPVADSPTDTINLTEGLGIDITGTAATDTMDWAFDPTEINDTTWGDGTETGYQWIINTDGGVDPTLLFSGSPAQLVVNYTLILDDGVTDSPSITLINATNISWGFQVLDATGNLDFRADSASTETLVIRNIGAGDTDVDIDGTLVLGTPASTPIAGAGAYAAASIDGDDIISSIAGDGIILTAAAPDTLDLDLNATLDGVGLTSSLAGLEFTATSELALLQGCLDSEILKWTDASATWGCSADASGGGGANSFETWDTPAGTDPVADSATDTITLTSGGGILITGTAASDTADFTLDLNATLDGVGLTSSLSGMEFTATSELALLQGCADGQVLEWEDTGATWDCATIVSGTHDILSATHTDSLAAAVSRGSTIIGNTTPAWSELVVGAANLVHYLNNATDVFWGDSDSLNFILEQTTVPGVSGGIIIDTNADNSNIIDSVLMFQSGATDYHVPSVRVFPTSDLQLLGINTSTDQFQYKTMVSGTVEVAGLASTLSFNMSTSSVGAIDDGVIAAAANQGLVIDTDGDAVNILHDTLNFRSAGENFFIPAPREYPTVDGQVLKFNATNDDWEWGTELVLTQEQVEDFAGALVANATGTHTGIAITYQDGTADMDFIVDHDGGINFVADEHVAHTGVVITSGTGLTGGTNIASSFTLDAVGGDGIIANSNDLAVDLNATLDGVGLATSLSGMEFTATSELALLQGCADSDILTWEDTGGTWDCTAPGGGTTHDILSATHTDSLAAAVTRGSIIVGNVTPAWSELVIGAAGTRLFSDGTDAAWANSDTAAFLLTPAVPATADGGIVIDTDGDGVEVIDDVLAVQSGAIDYHIPMMRTYPTSNGHVIALNRTTDQYVWKPLTSGNGISIASGATSIITNMVTEGVNAIHDATVPTTAENSLGIDTDGDGVNILNDVLSFRSDAENFFIPAPREYPTVDGQVLSFNATNDDWEWTVPTTQLTQEEVEDFAGALVANATGTHTGLVITYQDATGDMDFVIGGGDGIIANANDLAVDLNATVDGLGLTTSLSGMEFTATSELALLQGCANNEVLQWVEAASTWDCAAAAGGGTMSSFDITDTDASPILTVNDTEQIQFIGSTAITVVAAADTSNHDVTFSCDASTATTTGCLEQATQAEADAGTAGNLAVIASVLEAWNGGSNIATVGTIGTGVWNGTALTDAFVSDVITVGATGTVTAGAYNAASIDGDDIAASIAGNGLVLTAAAPDTLDIDLNATLDGVGLITSLSGMEFTATAELALLQGCADGEVLQWQNAGATWDCAPDADTQLTTEQVEDIAGALVANATGTHTGIAITYQDATGDMDFIVDHDGGINFVADEHVAHTGVVITSGTGLTGGSNIAASFTIDAAGGDGIVANANDLAIDLNATLDGVGATSNLSGMEFTATAELALLQGCSAGQVLKWEDTGATWDCAADADTGGAPALSAITDPVGDVSFTFDDGEEIDWVMTHSGPVGTDVFHIDFSQPDDADATDDIDVFMITLRLESGDVGDTIRGMKITLVDGVANTVLDAGWQIINDETTAATMTDAIRILSPGVDGGIVDAIDASAANIDNALNMGSNNIVTGSATISGGEMNILDGGILITEITTGTKANLESILSDVSNLAEASGDFYTGTHDWGTSVSHEIVNAAAPVVDTLGEIAIDTTDVPVTDGVAQFIYHDGGEVVVLPGVKHACFDIEELVAGDDDFAIWSPPYAVTIRGGYCYCNGACTVAGTVHFEKNRAGTITQIGGATTTGDIACSNSSAATEALTDLTSGTLTLASFDQLRFDTITAPTAVNSMNICWTYTVDRQ